MMDEIILLSWDRFGKMFRLNMATGQITSAKRINSTETNGTVKFFIFGKWTAVYKYENSWYIQKGKKRFALDSEMSIETRHLPPFSITTLIINGNKFKLYEFSPMKLLSKKFDPTYDSIDKMGDDYFEWLKDIREKQEIV